MERSIVIEIYGLKYVQGKDDWRPQIVLLTAAHWLRRFDHVTTQDGIEYRHKTPVPAVPLTYQYSLCTLCALVPYPNSCNLCALVPQPNLLYYYMYIDLPLQSIHCLHE